MQKRDYNIKVRIGHEGRIYEFGTYEGEYRNLMTLIADKVYIDGFGECKGMGRCGTCHLGIIAPEALKQDQDRKERATIEKLHLDYSGVRLACQILLTDRMTNIEVNIIN